MSYLLYHRYDPKGYRLAGKFLQVSGIKVIYDISRPNGSRVKSLKVLCKACREPSYVPLNLTQIYKVAVPTYIATGGDGFVILRDKAIAHHLSGMKFQTRSQISLFYVCTCLLYDFPFQESWIRTCWWNI